MDYEIMDLLLDLELKIDSLERGFTGLMIMFIFVMVGLAWVLAARESK